MPNKKLKGARGCLDIIVRWDSTIVLKKVNAKIGHEPDERHEVGKKFKKKILRCLKRN